MKTYFLLVFFLSNFLLSQKQGSNFEIKDFNNSIKTINYLKKANNCELLIFANINYKWLANPDNIKNASMFFSEIAAKTKHRIMISHHMRHGQEFIQTLREEYLKEQIEYLVTQNKCYNY